MYIRTQRGFPLKNGLLAWLRKLIHPYCWGTSDRFKEGFSSDEQVLRSSTSSSASDSGCQSGSCHAQESGLHVAFHRVSHPLLPGVRERKLPETLVLIDIDCHSRGSFEGAVQCVEWLREQWVPWLVLVPIDQWSWYPRLPCRPKAPDRRRGT